MIKHNQCLKRESLSFGNWRCVTLEKGCSRNPRTRAVTLVCIDGIGRRRCKQAMLELSAACTTRRMVRWTGAFPCRSKSRCDNHRAGCRIYSACRAFIAKQNRRRRAQPCRRFHYDHGNPAKTAYALSCWKINWRNFSVVKVYSCLWSWFTAIILPSFCIS